jgi:uncharacterized protein YndB with AHSA1/START domain
VPTYAARRTLLASRDDVWRFLAEPHNLADWWPGIAAVRPDRRGLAPGARWDVVGPARPGYIRRPQAEGKLLVLEVAPLERISFQLTSDRIDADLRIRALEPDRTDVQLTVEGPWLIGLSRRFPQRALHRLYSLLQTAATE